MDLEHLIDIFFIMIMVYCSIRAMSIFVKDILYKFKLKEINKEMCKYEVLLNLKIGIQMKIIDISVGIALICSLYFLIKGMPNIILKGLYIVVATLVIFMYTINITRKTLITNKGIVQITALKIIVDIVLWNEITNYSRADKAINIEYRRKNEDKKMRIRVINNEERNKGLCIIKSNIKNDIQYM